MTKNKIPKILFITRVPLGNQRNPTMIYMDKLIKNYKNQIIWFSINNLNYSKPNDYKIPFKSYPPFDWFIRFPLIKNFFRFFIGTKFLTFSAYRFGKEHKAKVVLADLNSEVLIVGRMTAKKLGVPLITSIQDDPISRLLKKKYPESINQFLKNQFKKTMTYSTSCAVVSDYMGEYYEKKFNVNTTTLYLGAKNNKTQKQGKILFEEKTIIIGSLGSVHSFKNLDLVIESINCLNKKNYRGKKFSLKHIGELPEKYLNLDNIHVTGWINRENLMDELKEIDIGLLSVSFQNSEKTIVMTSFPTKIYNFLEAQVPFLALGPEYSAIAKFIKNFNCGQICDKMNKEELISKILYMIDSKTNLDKTNRGLINAAAHFSRDNYFKKFEQIFKNL